METIRTQIGAIKTKKAQATKTQQLMVFTFGTLSLFMTFQAVAALVG